VGTAAILYGVGVSARSLKALAFQATAHEPH